MCYFHDGFMSSLVFFQLLFGFFKLNLEEFDLLLKKSLFFLEVVFKVDQSVFLFLDKLFIINHLFLEFIMVLAHIVLEILSIDLFLISQFSNFILQSENGVLRFFKEFGQVIFVDFPSSLFRIKFLLTVGEFIFKLIDFFLEFIDLLSKRFI